MGRGLQKVSAGALFLAGICFCLSGCDGKSGPKLKELVSSNPLPAEVAKSVTDINGTLWIDTAPDMCRGIRSKVDYVGYVGLAFKKDADPWPSVQRGLGASQVLPKLVFLDRPTDAEVKRLLLTAMFDKQMAGESYKGPDVVCLELFDSKYPGRSAYYKDERGTVTQRLAAGYTVAFDHAELFSEFDVASPFRGNVKGRKYRVFATLEMNQPFGNAHLLIESDLILIYNPIDRVWQVDTKSRWHDVKLPPAPDCPDFAISCP
jgi:hypothetical protein